MSHSELPTADDVPRADGMPVLGLGTWQNKDPRQCVESVQTALNVGYRHIDTAQAYDNEPYIGDAIQESGVDREDIFLATKVWIDNLEHENVVNSAQESLDELKTDYVDLLYVHWPAGDYDPVETLAALEQLYDEGRIEHVGVSNFQPEQIERAVQELDVPLFATQIELHPLLPQERIREACEQHGVNVVAYSPLARGKVFDVPEIDDVAGKHGASAAQVSLAWLRQKGHTAIPKATSEAHIRENWESLSLRLDEADVEKIDGIEERERTVDPDFAPW